MAFKRGVQGWRRPRSTPSVEAGFEYRAMLDRLKADDLPRFEARFKELLNENTIREVANFQSQLARERETIRERIGRINESMGQIDFNPGRYIRLEARTVAGRRHPGLPVRAPGLHRGRAHRFGGRRVLGDQVPAGEDDHRALPGARRAARSWIARWTARVTDVRNWFVFAASERWREDDAEHEHYSDSGGKSGGQKEKLAYTILAASLAYQFGLGWSEVRSRSFPLRGDRRGVRAGLRRVHAVRPRPVLEAQPAAPDRHPPAEDSRHRALRGGRRVRPQRGRPARPEAAQISPSASIGRRRSRPRRGSRDDSAGCRWSRCAPRAAGAAGRRERTSGRSKIRKHAALEPALSWRAVA